MATNEIDGLTFDLLTGVPAPAGMAVESFDRIGEDLSTDRRIGLREKPVMIETVYFAEDNAAADARIAAELAKSGELVTVSDAFGTDFANCRIESVEAARPGKWKQACIHNGVSKVLVRTRWTVRHKY